MMSVEQYNTTLEPLRVIVVGSGNVAEAMACALATAPGVELCQIYSRNRERGEAIARRAGVAWTGCLDELASADIYLIAVSDRAVGEVAASLPLSEDAIVAHTAGSVPLSVLPKREGRGIIYPLQSFSAGRTISLADVPLFVEADGERARTLLMRLASMLSSRVEYADSERRRVLHLAGVLVNNFVNALYAEGASVVESAGLNFDILRPLIMETARKAVDSDNPRSVQTGPASRGDMEVCRGHMAMLESQPQLQQIYKDITHILWETSKKI